MAIEHNDLRDYIRSIESTESFQKKVEHADWNVVK